MDENRSGQSRRDDGHLVDFLGVAAAGQVVDGRVQTLQDRAVGRKAAQTLRDLVADVAGLDAREDEGIGVTRDRGAGELQLADDRGDGSVMAVSMATSASFCAAEKVTSPVALSTLS